MLSFIAMIAFYAAAASPAAHAGSACANLGTSREVFCVCSDSSCWLEPGTRHHFNARFSGARALTEAGAVGLWMPVQLTPRRSGYFRQR